MSVLDDLDAACRKSRERLNRAIGQYARSARKAIALRVLLARLWLDEQ